MTQFADQITKAVGAVQPWARRAVAVSIIVGSLLEAIVTASNVTLKIFLGPSVSLEKIGTIGWQAVGFAAVFPIAWLWHKIVPLSTTERKEDSVRAYVALLNAAMKEAGLSKADQKLVWRAAFAKLAQDFSIDAKLPSQEQFIKDALSGKGAPDAPA